MYPLYVLDLFLTRQMAPLSPKNGEARYSLTSDFGLTLQQQPLIAAALLASENSAIDRRLRLWVRGQSPGDFGQLGDERHQDAARPLQDPVLLAHLVKTKMMSSRHT